MPESQPGHIDERSPNRLARESSVGDEWGESGEDEVPTVVLYVIAGLLLISFTLYLVIGGGHGHFH